VGKKTYARDIHIELPPVYGGKCLSPEAGHNWGQKCGKCADDKDVETVVCKWLRQQLKDLYAASNW
jgi:hypothetical protein